MIILYSLPNCPACEQVKRLLDKKNASYGVVNLSEDTKHMQYIMDSIGYLTAPITDIHGQLVVGYNESKLNELLMA